MKIVVDDAIVGARAAFAGFGEVCPVAGRSITAATVADADALVVRSVTRVDDALVAGSALQFVGSATAGVDHIDAAALARHGIAFAHAPGSNAPAVVDYVLSVVQDDPGPVGIVGVGAVGGRLAAALRGRGVPALLHDPPRERRGDAGPWTPLAELLVQSCIVTLHVPAIRDGRDATTHLIDAAALARMRPGALLINTARGAVVDNEALHEWLGHGEAVLDVWEGEPELRWDLLRRAELRLATPHIAGYARSSKARATAMMHAAIARHLGQSPTVEAAAILEAMPAGPQEPLQVTDARLRALLQHPAAMRSRLFEDLRRGYPLRAD